MRRDDKKINSREEIDQIIKSTEVCRIAYADNNIPYITPVSFGYDEKHIYVHTAIRGRKIDFLMKNEYVCFEFEADVKTITDPVIACKWTAAFKSVIGYGNMKELATFEEKDYAINEIMKHYSGKTWAFEEKMLQNVKLWKIEILEMSGKQSGGE
ncbi:pyridoxamine 5'-phosphate oxidase family protein [Lentimicrobium sp. L6]|uniref:pyridoxamine 5'-phosphate oxidase family protein n=1 Tax=Lentimicrobium sp. L6 TaxID=2735916 RepID=UPI001557311E|nr:pyridoxamine 5'-phosphate oxidase family protein [Lentimicrobium sp. L6]NPD87035.1 pyridoxamine 5'-phosphate oxidase family protein [Lentimicrobium sp. L6]